MDYKWTVVRFKWVVTRPYGLWQDHVWIMWQYPNELWQDHHRLWQYLNGQ
jgi:hypothetical protein